MASIREARPFRDDALKMGSHANRIVLSDKSLLP
jgi:hypothetical protein